MDMQVRMQDDTTFGVALPFGGSADAPVLGAFQDVLQQIGESNASAPGSLQTGNAAPTQTYVSTSDLLSSKGVPAIPLTATTGFPFGVGLKQAPGVTKTSAGPMPILTARTASIASQAGPANAEPHTWAFKRGQGVREAGRTQSLPTLSQAAALVLPNQPLIVNDRNPTPSAAAQTEYTFAIGTPNGTQAAPPEATPYAAPVASDVPLASDDAQELGLSTTVPNTSADSGDALNGPLPRSVVTGSAAASSEPSAAASLLKGTPPPKTDNLAQSTPRLAASSLDARRTDANAAQPTPKIQPTISTHEIPNTAHIEQISRMQASQPRPQQISASLATASTQSARQDASSHAQADNALSAPSTAAPLQTPEAFLSTPPSPSSAFVSSSSSLPGSPDRAAGSQAPALSKNTGQVAAGATTLVSGTNNTPTSASAATLADLNAGHENLPTGGSTGGQPLATASAGNPAPSATEHNNAPLASSVAPKAAAPSAAELTDVPSPTLTHARLMQTLNGSQMQVNLNTDEFGRISVHAGYSRDAVTAQITLESSQLGSAITAHLPGAEQKLAGDHGVRTAITVAAAATANGSSAEGRSGADQGRSNTYGGQNRSQKSGALSGSFLNSTDPGQPSLSTITPTPATSGRLNVTI